MTDPQYSDAKRMYLGELRHSEKDDFIKQLEELALEMSVAIDRVATGVRVKLDNRLDRENNPLGEHPKFVFYRV